jgi:hypothetical protein
MLGAIAQGSQMGPNDGWFGPGQSRYGWDWLAARCDGDQDKRITREEFPGPDELFQRLDRDRDGSITPEDFDWSAQSSFVRQAGMASQWFRMSDADSNGRVSLAEWEVLFAKAAKGRGYLTADDLRELFPTAPPQKPKPPGAAKKPPDAPTPVTLFWGLLSGEIGSVREGPRVGQPAPDFTLKTQDGKQRISLSQYRGYKPVVLVFGSFT